MAKPTPAFKRHRAHMPYLLDDGTFAPGTTTITGQLHKPGLVPWANKLGMQGIDSSEYTRSMAAIGTLAHALCMSELTGDDASEDTDEYSPKVLLLATKALTKFRCWLATHDFKPIFTEKRLKSEVYRYGGTIDIYGTLDGEPALIDLKTSQDIYEEMRYQLAAYRQLLIENGYPVNTVRIVRVGRDDDPNFDEQVSENVERDWQVFWHLRQIYDLRKGV